MNRRDFLLTATAGALGAEDLRDYPGVRYREYARVLPDYLRKLAVQVHNARSAEIAKLTTTVAIAKRKQWARDTFWSLIGGEPQRTALNIKTTGSFQRSQYRVEKLIYESRPGFHVTANLYLPKNAGGKLPGVLFQMGHAPNGKAGATYQKCCQGLVQLGYVVLGFDPQGQGERIYYPDASGLSSRLGSPDDEHTYAGKQMLLTGDSSTRLQLWDAVRSLDVLAAHPLVDATRLASAGQSGGGTLTMFLAAVDDRLAAAVVCSGNTENFATANFNPPGPVDDAEQMFPGAGPLGFDRWDTLYPFAPKPLLISVSHKDFAGTYSPRYIESGWEEFKRLRDVYAVLRAEKNIAWDGTALPHGLSYDTRLLTYNWLNRWLVQNSQEITKEPPVLLEKDETLWATTKGNVVREFEEQTPFSMNRTRAYTKNARTVLSVDRPLDKAAVVKATLPMSGIVVKAVELTTESEVFLPAWLYEPGLPAQRKGTLVLLQAGGRLVNWREDELFHTLALAGWRVVVPDVRGVGDLMPEYGRGAARHAREHADEDSYAWASLNLGVPLLQQRMKDIWAAVSSVDGQVTLAAQGKMTVPALLVAAAEPRITTLYLAGHLGSFRSLVETEQYNAAFVNFVPGVLKFMDLPEVAASLGNRKVVIGGAQDGAGRTMTVADARKLYGTATVLPDALWDLQRLTSL